MQVHIWQSFSSNNSSNYRLIARFAGPTRAAEVAAELRSLRGDVPGREAEGAALAASIGFDWEEWFPYGEDEDPTVMAEREVLAVYHSYCLGFPEELSTWLRSRGAEVEPQAAAKPQLSAVFALPAASEALREDLASVFGDVSGSEAAGKPMQLPWAESEQWGEASFFCDAHTAGFSVPIEPADLPRLKRWLAERGVNEPSLRIAEYDDTPKFATIARARCSGCGSALTYVEPKRHGLDAEQLGCDTCGAMYELSVIRAAAESKG